MVSSKLNIFKPPKSNFPKVEPLPAPGAPAKIRALGLPCTSFNNCTKLIIKYFCYKYKKKHSR